MQEYKKKILKRYLVLFLRCDMVFTCNINDIIFLVVNILTPQLTIEVEEIFAVVK